MLRLNLNKIIFYNMINNLLCIYLSYNIFILFVRIYFNNLHIYYNINWRIQEKQAADIFKSSSWAVLLIYKSRPSL